MAFLCVWKFVRIMKRGTGTAMRCQPNLGKREESREKKAKVVMMRMIARMTRKEEEAVAEKKSESPVEDDGEIKVAGFSICQDCSSIH